ncbi:MAG: Maf family nucleotide pyrophosphatase [Flavobacteriales bacterium]|jgi:septum formation protein
MILTNLEGKKIVLASKSPRRKQLLESIDIPYEVRTLDVPEDFPPALQAGEIPLFLSKLKASAFKETMAENEIIITADTVVWINGHVLNKPEDKDEAFAMISELSGARHIVYTAVTIMSSSKVTSFVDETEVEFRNLEPFEIEYYLDKYQPYDKAGAYGVQEYIGSIGIKSLKGSYFNVMGLPIHRVYEILKEY